MAEPQEQMDPYWEEVIDLTERLAASAWRLFREKGCQDLEAVLPGTGMSAMDLVSKTIDDLIERGQWIPGSGGKDPFPLAYRALHRDFLDLIELEEFKSTRITESVEDDYRDQIAVSLPEIDQESPALWINSLKRHLLNDQPAIIYLRVWLEEGYESVADIAKIMGISDQDVINIKRRLASKIHIWERLWGRKGRQ
jgi:DNA-directed RNA polymerase specialized sigma24 family protein